MSEAPKHAKDALNHAKSAAASAAASAASLPLGLPVVGALEGVINHFIARSERSVEDCARLAGSSFTVQFKEFNYRLTFLPNASGLQLMDSFDGNSDVVVKGSIPAFARMLIEQQQLQAARGAVEVSGDVMLAQRFAELLGGLDIDWQDELSRFVGGAAAHQVGRVAMSLFSWGKKTAQSLTVDTANYLRNDSRDVLAAEELEEFIGGVEELGDQLDHLQVRLDRLRGKLDESR